jgi:hypothetical protein
MSMMGFAPGQQTMAAKQPIVPHSSVKSPPSFPSKSIPTTPSGPSTQIANPVHAQIASALGGASPQMPMQRQIGMFRGARGLAV